MRRNRHIQILLILIGLVPATPTLAQRGDKAGEPQAPLPADLQVPAAPPLDPTEAMDQFQTPAGLRVELVAAEPLVVAPVTMAFGPDGRLWVVEMPDFMSDIDGTRELNPTGRIVVLEDTDQDGRMDTRTVFLDGLVLPRAVAIVREGVLVASPPDLMLARDTDGDGRADTTTVLDSSFGGLHSPEHAGNGLRWGLDNWLHCSQHPWAYRYLDGELQTRAVGPHGQWGLTCDEAGRWYYTPNSHPLMIDLLPAHVVAMNPNQRDTAGVYVALPSDKRVHPIRINPGVNRGYRKGTLNDDFTLRNFTAACGPTIYLDDVLGPNYEGDAFICEPSANTVEHRNLIDRGHQQPELRTDPSVGALLASTDERFRPVDARTGPDGALYIADLYRGILQHKIFMTTFLRNQVLDRQLDQHVDRGRIWRIVPDDDAVRTLPNLTTLDNMQRIELLAADNGTLRRLAQQQLVEAPTLSARELAAIETMARDDANVVAQWHALWTLEGRGAIDSPTLLPKAITDSGTRVQALLIGANHLNDPLIHDLVLEALGDEDRPVRLAAAAALANADAEEIAADLAAALDAYPADTQLRTLVVAGALGSEVMLLAELMWLDSWLEGDEQRKAMAMSIARTAIRNHDPEMKLRVLELLASIPSDQDWLAETIATQVVDIHRLRSAKPRPLKLAAKPFDWHDRLAEEPDLAAGLLALIDLHALWPGRPGYKPDVDLAGLSQEDAAMLNLGAGLYAHCTGCHQATGIGLRGFYPPLADSPLVLGEPDPLLAVLIHGLSGPVTVDGVTYDQPMPPAPVPTDQEVAAIASFIRRSFGNDASIVDSAAVKRVREATSSHRGPMTVEAIKARWPEAAVD